MILVDTNVLVDVIESDPKFFDWSSRAIETAQADDELAVGHVVLAELYSGRSPGFDVERWLAGLGVAIDPLDAGIARRAGIAQREYRRRKGPRTSLLADFLIGAHAAVRSVPLITRDPVRFASYFPELTLITPETQP